MSYNTNILTKPVSIHTLKQHKTANTRFACISLYDAATAAIAAQQGIEAVLIGDSLGMTIQGHDSTLPVTMEHMVYHTAAVKKGNDRSLIIADMPFMSYSTPEQAMKNAARLMQAGAHMIKIEGGAWLADTVKQLSDRGVPVCAHLGLTPQSVNKFGGFRVQGKNNDDATRIIDDAKCLDDAGADLLVLECVPADLAATINQEIHMPTIGIGAGKETTGQVLVVNDLIGLTEKPPKFSKNFLAEAGSIAGAFNAFNEQVKTGEFPSNEHCF